MPAETTIQFRQGTASQWSTANPTLAAGEVGFVTSGTDTWGKPNTFKIGDGTSNWKALGYPNQGVGTTLQLATAITVNGVTGVDWSQPSYTFPADATTLTGTTLKSTVVSSSLTKVGALSSGTAGFVKVDASGNLTSDGSTYLSVSATTLPSSVVNSSITKLGTLSTPSSNVNFVMIDPATNSLFKNPSSFAVIDTSDTLSSTIANSSLTKVGLTSAGFVKTDASGNLTSQTLPSFYHVLTSDYGVTWPTSSTAGRAMGKTFTVEANSTYEVEFALNIGFQNTVTAGVTLGFYLHPGSSSVYTCMIPMTFATQTSSGSSPLYFVPGTAKQGALEAASTNVLFQIGTLTSTYQYGVLTGKGIITTTATPGNIFPGLYVTNTTNSVVSTRIGSYFKLTKLGSNTFTTYGSWNA